MTGASDTLLLVLQPLSVMSGAGRLHSRTIASASDVVVDTIPDRETEINHYYSPQWKKTIFYWRYRYRTEEPPLGSPEPQLRSPYNIKWVTRHLFKYTP
jgi:hypothetical protein